MTTTPAPRHATILVYSTQKDVPDLFAPLGLQVENAQSAQDVLAKLSFATYAGLCIVGSPGDIESWKDFFAEVESKAMLEGLRAVLVIARQAPSMRDRLFAVIDKPWIHYFGLSAFRDVVEVPRQPTQEERDEVSRRISFAIQYNAKSPFASRVTSVMRHKSRADIHVPARLSWYQESNNIIGVECGAKIAVGTTVRLRTEVGSGIGSLVLSGKVKENMPAHLRFNYGNSLHLELDAPSTQLFRRATQNDINSPAIDKPVRRAFIVTRSLALRHRVIKVLAKSYIDSRVPLVKRNILSDLPYLAPHFVVIEDRVLSDLVERDGIKVFKQIADAAGPQACFAIVGEDAKRLSGMTSGFAPILDKPILDSNLTSWLNTVGTRSLEHVASEKRVWFPTNSKISYGVLTFDERIHQIGPDGVVLRGSNHLRMWNNFEVTLPGTRIQFLAKATACTLVCNPFHSNHHVVTGEHMVLTQLSALTNSFDLSKEFIRLSENLLEKLDWIRPQLESVRASIPTQKVDVKSPVITQKRKEFRLGVVYLVLILACFALLIYFMLKFDNSSEGFTRSFRELFSTRGQQ